jgi:hypothetical protein
MPIIQSLTDPSRFRRFRDRESALLFRQLAARIAELTRSFDKATLSARAFLIGCCLVAKLVDCSPSHLGGFASASGF